MATRPAATRELGSFKHWRLESDLDNITWLYIDRDGEKVNSLSSEVLSELSDIVDRFEDTNFHRRQLATLLLDQGFVAGVGNYLRSEILWSEEVHPRQKLGGMDPEERGGLAETTWRLTRRAYEKDSATIDDELEAERAGQSDDDLDDRYHAYGRESADCLRCGDTIVREEHGGRRVFLCPTCQPAPS